MKVVELIFYRNIHECDDCRTLESTENILLQMRIKSIKNSANLVCSRKNPLRSTNVKINESKSFVIEN